MIGPHSIVIVQQYTEYSAIPVKKSGMFKVGTESTAPSAAFVIKQEMH